MDEEGKPWRKQSNCQDTEAGNAQLHKILFNSKSNHNGHTVMCQTTYINEWHVFNPLLS